MPRTGLTRKEIVDAAIKLIDQKGSHRLSIHALARHLGVRAPSLYHHYNDLSEISLCVSSRLTEQIAELLKNKVKGKKGARAIKAMANAYRDYALTHPGLYQMSVVFPAFTQDKLVASFLDLREVFGKIIRENYDLTEKQVWSAARTLRGFFHGFVSLELTGGWSDIICPKTSFDQSIAFIITGFESSQKKPRRKR